MWSAEVEHLSILATYLHRGLSDSLQGVELGTDADTPQEKCIHVWAFDTIKSVLEAISQAPLVHGGEREYNDDKCKDGVIGNPNIFQNCFPGLNFRINMLCLLASIL